MQFSRDMAGAAAPFLAALLVGGAIPLAAQSVPTPGGRIAGRVVDQQTGRPVSEARVLVVGLNAVTTTDLDGRYRTPEVPGGKASLRVMALGYRPTQIDSITVVPGSAVTQNVALVTAPVQVEELVVQSNRPVEASSEAGLLALQAAAPAASDGISAETIAKAPDSDAGDAVGRVTGITTTDDGKSQVVRGLETRYTNTLVNGVEVASPEPLKRSVPLDIFDANLLESIVVSKAATPDRPGDFAGGSVEIRTKEFPENFTAQFSTSTEWNSETTWQPASIGSRNLSDFFGFDDGRRAQPRTRLLSFTPIPGTPEALAAEQFGEELRGEWTPRAGNAPLNGSLSLNVGGQVAPGTSTPLGYVGAINYSNSTQVTADRLFRFPEAGVAPDFPFGIDKTSTSTTRTVEWSGLLNLALKLGGAHKVSLKNLYNRSAEETFANGRGFLSEYQQSPTRRLYQVTYIERAALQSQLSGEHRLGFLGGMRFEWKGTYSVATRDEPENRELSYFEQTDGILVAAGAGDRFQFRFFEDKTVIGQGDLIIPVSLARPYDTEVKVGGLYRDRRRTFETEFGETAQYQGSSPPPEVTTLPPQLYWTPEVIGSAFTFRRRNPSDLAPYDADDDITALYGMVDLPLPGDIRLIGGVRVEDWRLTVFLPDRESPNPAFRRNRDVLWSGNLKIPVGDMMNVRLAAFASVARPDIREITEGVYFPVSGECGIRGNPDLRRSRIYSGDLKWEFFPSPSELVSVSGYYKWFSAPIVPVASGNAGSRCEFSVTNAQSARVFGGELEVRKQVVGPLSGSLNFSVVSSKATLAADRFFGVIASQISPRLVNQSPYIFNASVSYDDLPRQLNATVLFNLFGDRISEYGASGQSAGVAFIIPDRIEQARGTLDAKIRKGFGGRLGVTLAGKNLTNNSVVITQEIDGSDHVVGKYRRGVGVSVGVNYGI